MSKYKVFIDGQVGTTGLQILERLSSHPSIDILTVAHELRKSKEAKLKLMQEADVTILCLPDDAAKESAALAEQAGCRVLDASTAHRINDEWVYGLPELTANQRDLIRQSSKVANPGCYATGAILLLKPLEGLVSLDDITINAISGVSGGGNQLIAKYENGGPAYGVYSFNKSHKHIPEIMKWANLESAPLFIPSVANYQQGMLVFVPLRHVTADKATAIHNKFCEHYANEPFITVNDLNVANADTDFGFITPHGVEGKNSVEISMFTIDGADNALLVAKFDNLGKGASGAAVQNLNIMLGLDESICVEI
ncbi:MULTISPECIES: N-acetyl-gamma-glutamyl-phosphate reductase [Vibrio]|uniref:N-acetyl-gamma-glutamyl-phosphate reductase n=2 Tax=Vibrio TaxID=662 RepID=A0A7X4RW95_9VIBR|nr:MULTISPECIES: N-acetyl-gamma-glutamyl-phosphate reductase [Vibrio]MBF9000865.1 N-acetyl-gamma-glutamyl-phosphate reductase [Vibrio nitrifigilis]MZI94974.1 N-acetyl-gamma-glutamyl-phosphate reductase [Vibrio eleionomae]